MRALLGALAIIGAFGVSASAEPVSLDEASLGDVVAGLEINVGVNVANMIAAPVAVDNDIDLTNQIGSAVAFNVTAVTAALSNNVDGVGEAATNLAFGTGGLGLAGF
jgi:hypothetical protein